jgi:uncharacterized protein YndB with AHSA1/START domain
MTAEPLTVTFDVACPAERAFAVWTAEIDRWWPTDHTVTGADGLTVVLEGRPGGRIFERTADGTVHLWGQVTEWSPPTRLAYRWHLRQDPAQATEVEIRFVATGPGSTRVEIEHRGWDGLGAEAEARRQQNRGGWETLLPHYGAAIEKGAG